MVDGISAASSVSHYSPSRAPARSAGESPGKTAFEIALQLQDIQYENVERSLEPQKALLDLLV